MINLRCLKKQYKLKADEKLVLKDINLTVNENDFIAIMGKSGCGKSTLLNIIGCLDSYSGGSYTINGSEVSGFSQKQKAEARGKTFGFVFQNFNLLFDRTVLQNVMLPLLYSSVHKSLHEKLSLDMLKRLNIDELAQKNPSTLSGGEQQRVAIARALINNPDIILADEPTGNLDAQTGRQIMQTLCELHESGKAVILVTHDVKIAGYANKIIEIKNGTIETCTVEAEAVIC